MGLLNWLQGSKSPPADLPPSDPVPASPAKGTITSFEFADGVGQITLGDGTAVRFGRSACRGFDPVLDAPVVVEEFGPHPLGGVRATKVSVAEEDTARLDALHDQVAERRGSGRPTEQEAVGSALLLGTITVLLPTAPGEGRAGIREVFEAADILDEHVRLEFTSWPALQVGVRSMQVFVGREPFAADRLDQRLCGPDFDLGAGFLCISSGLADLELNMRLMRGSMLPDPWGPEGHIRRLTSIVQRIAEHGTGVVLHRAGNVVVPASQWLRWIGDVSNPECRPFGGWIDIGFTSEKSLLVAQGLNVFGLEDLAVDMSGHLLDVEVDRAHSALLLACYVMARENRALEEGEVLVVPRGVQVGAWPLADYPPAGDTTAAEYEVAFTDEGPVLTLRSRPCARPS
jgi:hypothetical protein